MKSWEGRILVFVFAAGLAKPLQQSETGSDDKIFPSLWQVYCMDSKMGKQCFPHIVNC